jgi:anti-sigma factor ChrR (cupin superfamily)
MEESSKPIILQNLFGPNCDFDKFDWQPFREGIELFRLYGSPHRGPSAALLRYAPGAYLPHHSHTGYEHILILSQSQSDDAGIHHAGTLVINPPGSGHTVKVKHGCIVLAIWEHPVIFSDIGTAPIKPR